MDLNVVRPKFKPAQPYTGSYKKGSDIPGVAPRETKPSPDGFLSCVEFTELEYRGWRSTLNVIEANSNVRRSYYG